MSDALLCVHDCSFAYGEGEFRLERVSLDLCGGQVLGIVGPNGSGKSTLLRVMAGLVRPDGGEVHLHGESVHALGRRRVAREVAFLPQTASATFGFTVEQVVAMGRYPHQSGFGFLGEHDAKIIAEALDQTECAHLAERAFVTLSGGERQRALMAGVLAQEPAVMLLDEPTAALDIHHQVEVFDLVRRLSRRGPAAAVVTHDLSAAGRFCDALVLMDAGRIAQAGAPADVLREELLSRVYRADVRVCEHPITGTPLVTVAEVTRNARQ